MMKGKGLSSDATPTLSRVLLCLLVVCAGARAAEPCEIRYRPGDRALFDFVATRQAVRYEELEGRAIGALHYVVLPVFDQGNPEEDNWLYRTFNFLHVSTRPRTLERQMIIAPAQPLRARRIEENERLLRDNKYLADAMILPHRVCADRVDLLVVVRDVWTLSPSASVSRSGGENSSGAGISEDNLFGTGQELSLGYSHDADRNSRSVSFRSPQLFGNHSRLYLAFADNSDGKLATLDLRRPFYQLDSRWSAGGWISEETREVRIEEDGEPVNSFVRDTRDLEIFYGGSRGIRNHRVHRWLAGFRDDRETFAPVTGRLSDPPRDVRVRYPWVGWEFLENRYLTTSNITYSHRLEDLLLGLSASARIGYASEDIGSSEDAVVFQLGAGYTVSIGAHHLLRLNTESSGRYDTDAERFVSTFVSAGVAYYNFIDRRNRWFVDLRFDAGRNLRPDEEFTTGGVLTLRGYPEEIQRGNRRWVFRAERRHFTDIHLFSLAWLGGAAYVDVGRTWNTDLPDRDEGPVLSNVGLGLRLSPSKFRVDKVVHLDVAFPLVEREHVDGHQFIVTTRVDF